MIKEFDKIGIKNYQFIEAVDKTSQLVRKTMKSPLVHKFPPCFRCKKMSCKHKNKKLLPSQVGNWLSYRMVWRDIIKNKHNFCLICEDDLFFTDYAVKVMMQALTDRGRKQKGIVLDSATLIRLGWKKGRQHNFRSGKVRVTRALRWANPCHAINLAMAKKLENNLFKIDTTSDGYIHNKIGMMSNHYTILPPIAYELSFGNNPKFRSEIIPKKKFIKKLRKDLQSTYDPETRRELQKKIAIEERVLNGGKSPPLPPTTKSSKPGGFEPKKAMEAQKKIIGEIIDEKNKLDIASVATKNEHVFIRQPKKMVVPNKNKNKNKNKSNIPIRRAGKPFKLVARKMK